MINYALTTKERVKARTEMTATALDTVIETFIASFTSFIEMACNGRRFFETTYTNEIYSGSDMSSNPAPKKFLILKNAPVTSITKIEYNNGSISTPNWVQYTAEEYQILENGIVKVNLPSGFNNVRVTYVAGYKIDFANVYDNTKHTLPFEVTNLCEKMTIKAIKKRESEGKSQETLRDSTIIWGPLMEPEDNTVIANYRRSQFI